MQELLVYFQPEPSVAPPTPSTLSSLTTITGQSGKQSTHLGQKDKMVLANWLVGLAADRGLSFKRYCVLHQWKSETLKYIINHKINKVN